LTITHESEKINIIQCNKDTFLRKRCTNVRKGLRCFFECFLMRFFFKYFLFKKNLFIITINKEAE
jgi:hypothetical protein